MKMILDSLKYILFTDYEKKVYTFREESSSLKNKDPIKENVKPNTSKLPLKDQIFAYFIKNFKVFSIYGFPSMDHEYEKVANDFRIVTGMKVSNSKFKQLAESLAMKTIKTKIEKAPF